MALTLHTVAIDAQIQEKRKGELITTRIVASGLAIVAGGDRPLILTTANITMASAFVVSFSGGLRVPAEFRASAPIKGGPETAFSRLAAKGWQSLGWENWGGPSIHLLRVVAPLQQEELLRMGNGSHASISAKASDSDADAWVGIEVISTSAALYEPAPDSMPVVPCIQTRGVVVNISKPAGLLLLDTRCTETFTGCAISLHEPLGDLKGATIVACLAPPLRSKEANAFGVAILLYYVFRAILESRKSARNLTREEHALFSSHLQRTVSVPQALVRPSTNAISARRGVALLWLVPSGTWASGVVLSENGYIVTCAHFLTGSSWMEANLDKEDSPDSKTHGSDPKLQTPRKHLPTYTRQNCSGRTQVIHPDGQVAEQTFEVDVLHVFEGYLDVALLRAKSSSDTAYKFMPLPWSTSTSVPQDGAEIWAVGHGLFGPGTPWAGASITAGQLSKVSYGVSDRGPAVLQSSAAVHRGCSGGALIDAAQGLMIGLVTTNVKHQDGNVMPRVNFSLPCNRLAPLRDFLADPTRPDALESLAEAWSRYAADELERSLWRLEPEPILLESRMEQRKQDALERLQRLAQDAETASVPESAQDAARSLAETTSASTTAGGRSARGVEFTSRL